MFSEQKEVYIKVQSGEVRTIRQYQKEQEEKTIFLCKEVNPDYLGREVYADEVETPYNFYLIRKLYLAKDYHSLAEGEAFFDTLCDSWDAADQFNNLAVKKIFTYVETEMMYYTVYFGSFEPTNKELRVNLKEWIQSIPVNKVKKEVARVNLGSELAEVHSIREQLAETTNDMLQLKQMIYELNKNLEAFTADTKNNTNPVISRSIRTIHLKRVHPLLNEESQVEAKALEEPNEKATATVVVQPTETPEAVIEAPAEQESTELPKEEPVVKAELTKKKSFSSRNKEATEPIVEDTSVNLPVSEPKPVVFLLEKQYTSKLKPSNWPRFSKLMKKNKQVMAPPKTPSFTKSEMENMEDEIYLRFMSKRIRNTTKRNHVPKVSVTKQELQTQITQARYLHYSWNQVLKQRKEDVLICGRLSCGHLEANLDEFLAEVSVYANKRTFFSDKVRCPIDTLRKLEGYSMLDTYMQRLSEVPVEQAKN